MQRVDPSRGSGIKSVPVVLAGILALALDQLSKFWVRNNLIPGLTVPDHGIIRFTYTDNPGGVLGLILSPSAAPIFALAVIALALFLYIRYLRFYSLPVRIGASLLIAGGIGNLIDRVTWGNVTDFIDVQLGSRFAWPTFNLADVSIFVGAGLLALFVLLEGEQRRRQ